MPVSISIKDERTIQIPFTANKADLLAVGSFITNCAQQDYKLADAATLEGGHQKDPIAVGIRLTFQRG